MSERSGPFWDAIEGRAPMPRAAATLGLELIDAGRVIHRHGDLAFLEASLIDSDDATVATATATARVIPLGEARAAA